MHTIVVPKRLDTFSDVSFPFFFCLDCDFKVFENKNEVIIYGRSFCPVEKELHAQFCGDLCQFAHKVSLHK